MRNINSALNDFIQTTILLALLGAIIEVTGTHFWGINLLPLIITIITLALIIKGLQSDKRTVTWITTKLKRIFQ